MARFPDDKPECEYGIDCYRKNPQHRKDFKHTKKMTNNEKKKEIDEDEEENDSYESSFIDDEDESQRMDLSDEESELNSSNIIQSESMDIGDEDDDKRPECEFGTDCYRKNPQHKKDYKHTKRPKRRVVRNKMKMVNDGNSDDEQDVDVFEDSQEQDISNDEESVDEWNPDEDD